LLKKNNYFLLVLLLISFLPGILAPEIVNPDSHVVMSHLLQLDSISSYVSDLINLNTIDFQPLRDASLYLDIFISNKFNLNITVFHNLLVWFVVCLIIRKITLKLFPKQTERTSSLFLLLFALHPLFSNTLLWGVARKHTLSLLFIMLATNEVLKELGTKRSFFKIGSLYFLSILSQPINLLWPAWGIYFLYKKKTRNLNYFIFIMMIVFATGFGVNWYYYKYSSVFNLFYQSKLDGFYNISDKVLALGHYFFQLILPLNLNYIYELGHWQSLWGIPIGVLFIYFFIKKIKDLSFVLSWLLFGAGPLIIITNTPNLLQDCYLLTPAFPFFVLLIKAFEDINWEKKINKSACLGLCLFFIFNNFIEAKNWISLFDFTKQAFVRRPSCATAIKAGIIQFDEFGKIETNLRSYLENYNCIKIDRNMTLTQVDSILRFNSQVIYYENTFNFYEREKLIQNMAQGSVIPYFYLLGLYAKTKSDEKFDNLLDEFRPKLNAKIDHFEKVVSRDIYPYCQTRKQNFCLETLGRFIVRKKRIWL